MLRKSLSLCLLPSCSSLLKINRNGCTEFWKKKMKHPSSPGSSSRFIKSNNNILFQHDPSSSSSFSSSLSIHLIRSFHESLVVVRESTASTSETSFTRDSRLSSSTDIPSSSLNNNNIENSSSSIHHHLRFQETELKFRNALLSSVMEQRNRDIKFYWTLFTILASVGSVGFEVLFRILEMPYMGAVYAASLLGYVLFQRTVAIYSKGSWLAKSVGAVEICEETETSPEKLRVYRMVKEIADSIQLKMPSVCYIECEEPNAFACGYNLDCACVTVTSGLAKLLNDMELKSVLAHEIGHVINGDMKTGTLISAMIGAFTLGHK